MRHCETALQRPIAAAAQVGGRKIDAGGAVKRRQLATTGGSQLPHDSS